MLGYMWKSKFETKISIIQLIGVDEEGNAQGHFEACGVRPLLLNRLIAKGVEIPPDLFQRRILAGSSSVSNN